MSIMERSLSGLAWNRRSALKRSGCSLLCADLACCEELFPVGTSVCIRRSGHSRKFLIEGMICGVRGVVCAGHNEIMEFPSCNTKIGLSGLLIPAAF